ncbi:hypothetical protein IID24_05295 [Patescibacteria group bacterium]|nr:hypothetical protein [Patescibacteria group bacterium]
MSNPLPPKSSECWEELHNVCMGSACNCMCHAGDPDEFDEEEDDELLW